MNLVYKILLMFIYTSIFIHLLYCMTHYADSVLSLMKARQLTNLVLWHLMLPGMVEAPKVTTILHVNHWSPSGIGARLFF